MPDEPQMQRKRALQVLIVEDDPIIASVYKRTVSDISRLEVAGTVARGEDALAFLKRHPCDLMLLDLKLAGMSGLTLLQRLRGAGYPIEVICLTASCSSSAVRALVQRGAVDYLVKPFTVERLRQSLGRYLYRVAAFRESQLDQEAVDRVCAAGRSPKRWLPKGLTEAGVSRVCDALDERGGASSSTEIANAAGLARVTARRYLEYLVATGLASVEAVPAGPGRPRKLYRREQTITVGTPPAELAGQAADGDGRFAAAPLPGDPLSS
jgi:two-component system response regulator DctR